MEVSEIKEFIDKQESIKYHLVELIYNITYRSPIYIEQSVSLRNIIQKIVKQISTTSKIIEQDEYSLYDYDRIEKDMKELYDLLRINKNG